VIARYWRGWTKAEHAAAYQDIVSNRVLPSIAGRGIPGYHGAYLLRRELDGEVEFATILLFSGMDAVRTFGGGDDYARSYVPAEGRAVLAHFDETAAHYEILLSPLLEPADT
jgi:hypothetical protein